MPQDAFTLNYLVKELDVLLKNGKVNKIIQPSNEEIVLTVYNGKEICQLLLDVNPASPKVVVFTGEKTAPLQAPNFCMLLRKHLLSATLKSVSLVGFDRIVKIELEHKAEFSDAVNKCLYVELMGRYSNVILTENGKVLGGNRGINFFDNGVRPLISGKDYVLPPTGDKFAPNDKRLLQSIKSYNGQDLTAFICACVQGVSTQTAKEAVYLWQEKNGDFDVAENAESFYDFLNKFLLFTPANPCVLFDNGKVKDVLAFPYKTQSGEYKFYNKLYLAEDEFFRLKETGKRFLEKKDKIVSVLSAREKKLSKKIAMLSARKKDADCAEENKLKGELIISNVYRLAKGQKECVLENFYDEYKPIKIELDEQLSPSQNAEKYFKKYTKQKRTVEALVPQIESLTEEEKYLKSVKDETDICETIDDLNAVLSELESFGLVKEQKNGKRKKEQKPFREYSFGGYTIKAGRNNVENDALTLSAKAEDIWVHAKDLHSSHVIIETNRKKPQKEVIAFAAEICAYYSKGREEIKTEIVYTEKKHVKKPKKSKAGFCTYEHFSSITVRADKHAENIKDI